MPVPFRPPNNTPPPPQGGPLVGQPFRIDNLSVPVNASFTCTCDPTNVAMPIVMSAPVHCEKCQKTYVVAINPLNGQLLVSVTIPDDQVPA